MRIVKFHAEVRWAGCRIEDEFVKFEDDVSNETIEEAWLDWFMEQVGGGGWEDIL